jgi:dihydropteroate synthase
LDQDLVEKIKNNDQIAADNFYALSSALLFTGSMYQIKAAVDSMNGFPSDSVTSELKKSISNFESYCNKSYNFKGKEFDFGRSCVMGVLNVTPDSFSDGGNYFTPESAVDRGLEMINQGAEIIDIGGESTRPGSDPVTADEELKRVIPVVKEINSIVEDSVISIDTTKAKVAEEALKRGATIINDISGGTFEPEIIRVAQDYDAGFVVMHTKGRPKTMQQNPQYDNLIQEIYDFLSAQVLKIREAGITKIFIDPGIGFGKTSEDNFTIIQRLEDFKSISFPILTGISRKSFIGKTLKLETEKLDSASNAINCLVIDKGARIIRTHNVKLGVQVCKLMNNML